MMMMSIRHPLLALALLLLAAGTPLGKSANAQMGGPYGGGSGSQQQLLTARANLSYAQANVDRLKDRAERSLASDRNWTAAKTALAEAKKNRDAVREQVKKQVEATPEYQALQQHREAASSDTQKAEARARMATIVWEAQQNSPDCEAAQAQLNQAQADLDARWKEYETRVLANDPEWRSALATRDTARAQVSAALEAQHASSSVRSSGSRSSYSSGRSGSGSRGYRSSSHGGSRTAY